MNRSTVDEDIQEEFYNGAGKNKWKQSVQSLSLISDGDIGRTVSVKLHYHRRIRGILTGASKTEIEVKTRVFCKDVRIVAVRRYVVSVEFLDEAGEK